MAGEGNIGGGEPVPYRPNRYREKMGMLGDAADVLLETYGWQEVGYQGQPIDTVVWQDVKPGRGFVRTYKLSRFQPEAEVHVQALHQMELLVSDRYTNQEESVRCFAVNPVIGTNHLYYRKMTTEQRKRYDNSFNWTEKASASFAGEGMGPECRLDLMLRVMSEAFEAFDER